jgi:hypothetical protein
MRQAARAVKHSPFLAPTNVGGRGVREAGGEGELADLLAFS